MLLYWKYTTKDEELARPALDDVKKLVTKGVHSDLFAVHFARHCTPKVKLSSKELRAMMKYQIIWQGNPISCMKTFGKVDPDHL